MLKSGRYHRLIVEAYRAAGMDGHVGKLFDRGELLAMVARMLPAHGDAAEVMLHPGLDEKVYLATKRALSPPRLRQVLGISSTELRTSFERGHDDEDARAEHRRWAHMPCAPSAVLRFTALSVACRELEEFDEAKVEREGLGAFAISLAEARGLAENAQGTVEKLFREIGRRHGDRVERASPTRGR